MRWFVVVDGDPVILEPQSKYTWKWKRHDQQAFYRLELSKALEFGGRERPQDFAFLKAIYADPIARYDETVIICEMRIGGEWREFWRGVFCGNDFDVDECACTITFKPSVLDAYTCILDGYKQEHNIIAAGPMLTVKAPRFLPFEYHVCRPSADCVSGTDKWSEFYENTVDDDVKIFWREYRIVPCVAGSPQPPDNSGDWLLITDNCDTDGTAKYAREAPTLGTPPEVVQGHCIEIDGVPTPFPPPNPVEKEVTAGDVSDDPPVIQGPEAVFRVSPAASIVGLSYRVRHPRGQSTYTWTVPSDLTIVAGQGTPEITVHLLSTALLTSWDVDVIEHTACEGDVPAATFTSYVFANVGWRGTNVNAHLFAADMYAPAEFKTGDTFEVTLPFDVPDRATRWEVEVGGSPLLGFVQMDRKVVIPATTATQDITVRYGYESLVLADPVWSPTITVVHATAPASDPISGPSNVCAGDEVRFTVPVKSSVSLEWIVPSDWTIQQTGPGFAVVLVGSSGTLQCEQTLDSSAEFVLIAPCGPGGEAPWYWAFDDEDFIEYTTGRRLLDVLQYLFAKACPPTAGRPTVVSDFFQHHPQTPSPENYVTGSANKLMHLTVHSKGDVLHPDFSQMTTIANWSLQQLLEDVVCVMFNARWSMFLGSLRIEHASFRESEEVVDLRALMPSCRYKYEKVELPRSETYKFSEGSTADFVGLPIMYDLQGPVPRTKHPAVSDESLEFAVPDVATDLPFITNASDDEVERTGLVVLQCRINEDSELWVEQEPGAITGMPMPNAHLAWANLHEKYFRFGRSLNAGYLNGEYTEFTGQLRIKKEEGSFGMCAADLFAFDPRKLYQTKVGPRGEVDEAELDFFNERIKLQLEHEPL